MVNRADNKDGSCREILTGKHKGKWRVQFTLISDSGSKSRLSRIFPTKTAAKNFLQELRRGGRIEAARRSRGMTLAEWHEWLADNDWPESIAPVTIGYRRSRFRKHIAAHLGHFPLDNLDALRVRSFYRYLRDSGCSDSLILSVKSDLVRLFNQAVTPYQRVPITTANPFRLPVQQPKPRQAVALTPDEVRQALASSALDQSQRALLALFLLGGLRLGEVMAFNRGQIRFDEDLIAVDRAVHVEYGGKQWVGFPKGDKTRCAVMCRTLKGILAPFVAEVAPEQLLWPAVSENKPRMKKRFYELWKAVVTAAGLPKGMSPHDCRLTHINLIEKLMPDVSETTLKEHIGHSATGVTQVNYTRPISPSQKILRDEIERVLGTRSRSKKL